MDLQMVYDKTDKGVIQRVIGMNELNGQSSRARKRLYAKTAAYGKIFRKEGE